MWTIAYDAGCTRCRGIAQAVADESQGRLQIASLHDPNISELINNANKRTDRPALINTTPSGSKVLQGAMMGFRMLLLLGPRRASRIIHLIGNEEQEHPNLVEPSRRNVLRAGSVIALGAIIGGGAIAGAPSARAGSDKRELSGWRRLLGTELDDAVNASTAIAAVATLIQTLDKTAYTGVDQLASTAVAIGGQGGRTLTILPLWEERTKTLAVITVRSWKPDAAQVSFLQESDGQVQNAFDAPGARDPEVAPMVDWACWWECARLICPACVSGCIWLGPLAPQCIVNCCGVALGVCLVGC